MIRKYADQPDANTKEIVNALRKIGFSVAYLKGKDLPDLLVGTGTHNLLFEIKPLTGKLAPKPKALRPGQKEFFDTWRGPKFVISTIEEAVSVASQKGPRG